MMGFFCHSHLEESVKAPDMQEIIEFRCGRRGTARRIAAERRTIELCGWCARMETFAFAGVDFGKTIKVLVSQ